MTAEIDSTTKLYGIVPAVVVDNDDPLKLGRVRIHVPALSMVLPRWARVLTPTAGGGWGIFFLLQVDDEVLVMFERGDVNAPYVIGSLWNAAAPPPPEAPQTPRSVHQCVIQSPSGHRIMLDDTSGQERIVVQDRTQKNKIEIDTVANTISITSDKDLSIAAGGNVSIAAKGNIKLDTEAGDVSIGCKSLTVKATQSYGLQAAQGKVEAIGGLDLQCMAGVKINNDGLVVT